ncbi:uncharacterized protein LOC113577912 [Electrophorus electricus]|uniref:uncharacterized protein LOC113577912 n=1 Tax=Electrophorus electricus TaxID=8005 RepID=UPI0015D039EE|nr:uncharacterized protein LOC113577912 [Electrophorus electricus]
MAHSRCPPEICFKQEHLTLSELKENYESDHHYLWRRNILPYPESVLFTTSRVCHVTGESGFRGIIRDGGFRKPPHLETEDNFLWWSLSVTKSEIAFAEKRFYRWTFEDADYNQSPFLEKFTTSPAFQSESRYGNFRFTFPFRKLLREYAQQFCEDSAPVLRVLCTELYRQQILYTVLVHPRHVQKYGQYPRLPYSMNSVCGYRDGYMSWLCQSPSDSYFYKLVVDNTNCQMFAKPLKGRVSCVWDNVAVAFHMEPGTELSINRRELLDSVSVCDMTKPNLLRDPGTPLDSDEANKILQDLRERNGLGQQKYYAY